MRTVAGLCGGAIAWLVIATIGNLALRLSWPAYVAVENEMTFTLGMQVARLLLGALASLGAGATVAWITKGSRRAPMLLAGILLVLFLPVHYQLWDKFPVWYHVVFLSSLVVMTLLGAMLYRRGAPEGPPLQPEVTELHDGSR